MRACFVKEIIHPVKIYPFIGSDSKRLANPQINELKPNNESKEADRVHREIMR